MESPFDFNGDREADAETVAALLESARIGSGPADAVTGIDLGEEANLAELEDEGLVKHIASRRAEAATAAARAADARDVPLPWGEALAEATAAVRAAAESLAAALGEIDAKRYAEGRRRALLAEVALRRAIAAGIRCQRLAALALEGAPPEAAAAAGRLASRTFAQVADLRVTSNHISETATCMRLDAHREALAADVAAAAKEAAALAGALDGVAAEYAGALGAR